MIFPDARLGVLGGGQLGRMFTLAAHSMGYQVWVLDPDPHSPAGQIADHHLQADYTDPRALDSFAANCAAITTEFENVPADALEQLATKTLVRPGPGPVAIARDRIAEKTFIRELGLDTAPFVAIRNRDDLTQACQQIRLPALLKTAQFGYDGKGQLGVDGPKQARQAFEQLGGKACVLEERIDLKQEVSVILARSHSGETAFYPVGENVHRNGILHTTTVPASISDTLAEKAIAMAGTLADALDYCGVLAVEFFIDRQHHLLINEMAPRPHNSGHYSLDACVTDQFAQQVRTLCGLPPGSTRLLSPVVMTNLLGELWHNGESPDWQALFRQPQTQLHLYGKKEARPGRKMGHYNCLADDTDQAFATAERLFRTLDN